MNIFFINPFFPPWAPGGAEHSLELLSRGFAAQGWSVDISAVSLDGRGDPEMRDGYTVHWMPAPDRVPPGQEIPDITYLRTGEYIADVRSTMQHKNHNPNVIIANNAQSYKAAVSLAKEADIPTIGIVRDTQMICETGACMDNESTSQAMPCSGIFGAGWCNIRFHRARGERGLRPWPAWFIHGIRLHHRRLSLRHAVRQFTHLVTISDSLNMLIKNAMPSYPVERITTIHNLPTIVEPAQPKEVQAFLISCGLIPGRYFLFAGRKSYGKGADLAAQAIKIGREHGMDHQLILVGRGKVDNESLLGVVDEPSISQAMLMALLENATALLIPGRWQEGLHRTMIDALRLGVPVICSLAGAPSMDGVNHQGNGLIIPCNDPVALANAMMDVAGWDQGRRDVCRRQAQILFHARFSEDVVIHQWKKLFEFVLNSYGGKLGLF